MNLREDLIYKHLLEAHGWKAEYNKRKGSYSYIKGSKHLWMIRDGWMLCELSNGYYCKHERLKDIKELWESVD